MRKCPKCGGDGIGYFYPYVDVCSTCNGNGVVSDKYMKLSEKVSRFKTIGILFLMGISVNMYVNLNVAIICCILSLMSYIAYRILNNRLSVELDNIKVMKGLME